MDYRQRKEQARYILQNRMNLPAEHFTVQGFGFMRYRIDDNTRLHIWHSSLRIKDVSDIHDHAQWAFKSTILCGELIDIDYIIGGDQQIPHMGGIIKCGIGGGMLDVKPTQVFMSFTPHPPYKAGDSYEKPPEQIHRTDAVDGTVTVIEQKRTETDTARVFWPTGVDWVNAVPRPATADEIDKIGEVGLFYLERDFSL